MKMNAAILWPCRVHGTANQHVFETRILSDRSRPTTAANTGDDKVVSLSYWANHSPLNVEDYEVSPVGLNKGTGIDREGHMTKLQITITVRRGKQREDREVAPGSEVYQMTANSVQ
jgi:hypothetical protein